MFSIHSIQKDGFNIVQLCDYSCQTTVEIVPSIGGILQGFTVQHNGAPLNVIDHYPNASAAENEFESSGFKSAKLSPFVCRMKNGQYRFSEQTYKIEGFYLGDHAIHGLIYKQPFEVIEQSATEKNALVKMICHYRKLDSGYPFDYDCEVTYQLSADNQLQVSTTIINKDAGHIPVADGWHPYFSFGGSINECMLEFQGNHQVEFDDQLIPTGEQMPYETYGSLKLLGDQFFDNCFVLNFAECQPMLVFRDPVKKIQLEIRPDQSYPYLQIYTPPHRKSIAIENLSAAPDAFNNGMGLITLPAGESVTFTTQYSIHSL
jgi:aldose 1-epimerase